MKNHQLINSDSGNYEYYTPQHIVDAARSTMGTIDLDPCSSQIANGRVQASIFFTESDNSLIQHWFGNVWMNHPFSRENNKKFIEKLVNEYEHGFIDSACCITFASTSEKWFRPLLHYPQCYLYGRTNYYLSDGTLKKGVTKGSVVTYLGDNIDSFRNNFKLLGAVKI